MRTPRVLLLLITVLAVPVLVLAQPAAKRAWIDVNFGVAASTAGEKSFTYDYTVYSERANLTASYPKPSPGANFDFGLGFLFTPVIGVAFGFTGTAHQDTAGLAATIPHPFFFAASATGVGTTDKKLTRSEGGINIQVVFVPLRTPRTSLRVFGGPTYFRYKADMVQDVGATQSYSPVNSTNTIRITGYEPAKAEGTGWGAHIGFDASYFFSRVVGVGGFMRFSGGNVSIDEPLSEEGQTVKVGGLQAGGGLRLRF